MLTRYQKYKKSYIEYALVHKKLRKKVANNFFDKKDFGGNKQKALKRDGYKCVKCGMTNKKHKIRFGCEITVDHIDGKGRSVPVKEKNNSLKNLQTLCIRCHMIKDRQNFPRIKLIPSQVEEIRNIYPVSLTSVWRIINKKKWKELI